MPSTQPNRIAHNLAAHHRAAHHPVARWCAGSVCAICTDSNVGWPNVGPTSVLSSRRWANVIPTYIALWQVRLWRGLPIPVTHTTEPAHHRAAGLCAARWRAARLCAIRLGCVDGHPRDWQDGIFISKRPLASKGFGIHINWHGLSICCGMHVSYSYIKVCIEIWQLLLLYCARTCVYTRPERCYHCSCRCPGASQHSKNSALIHFD